MAGTPDLPAWLPQAPPDKTQVPGLIEDGMDYEDRLFHYSYNTSYDELHFLEYRLLHRINVANLQNKLALLKGGCWEKQRVVGLKSTEDVDELRTALHHYVTAIKDYAYMQSLQELPQSQSEKRQRDLAIFFPEIAELEGSPYNSRYRTLHSPTGIIAIDPIRKLIGKWLPHRLTWAKTEIEIRTDEYLAGKPPTMVSPFVDRLTRFIVAFAGGASLVVPMLIMSLPSVSKVKSLITVSVAVTLFALLLSIGMRTSNSETLVSTATYAAVLVVFVGTSS